MIITKYNNGLVTINRKDAHSVQLYYCMTLFSFGPLYIGLDDTSFNDAYCTSAALCVHLGRVRLEWDCPQRTLSGSTQTTTNIKDNRQTPISF